MSIYDKYQVVFCKTSRPEYGSASIGIGRNLPGDLFCFAVLLVDFWKLGLKDAFGSKRMSGDEFAAATTMFVEDNEMAGIELEDVTVEEVKQRIARGIRIAKEVGTPPADKKFLEILGNVNEFEANGSLYKCYSCGKGELSGKVCNEILEVAKRELNSGVAGTPKEKQIYYECKSCWAGTKVDGKNVPYPW
jgi:hypothetical protein